MKISLLLTILGLALASQPRSQDPALDWKFENPQPAFESGQGPRVRIDQAHNNFHSIEQRHAPFARLLVGDGYRVGPFSEKFTKESLAKCEILVIGTAVADANVENWRRPHDSAFTTEELQALLPWISSGGSLLLILDHAPIPGASAELCVMLGVLAFNGEARNDSKRELPDEFRLEDGGLVDHPILRGLPSSEEVEHVYTWTGTAFQASRDYQPLLVYGSRARAWADLSETIPGAPGAANPVFEVEGWFCAAARRLGKGSVIVLGEARMCAEERNAQFSLNVLRWLSGILDEGEPGSGK